jgi:hypothetical protein
LSNEESTPSLPSPLSFSPLFLREIMQRYLAGMEEYSGSRPTAFPRLSLQFGKGGSMPKDRKKQE